MKPGGWASIALSALLTACVTPAQRVDGMAHRLGLRREVVQGAPFAHMVYRNEKAAQGGTLHIYLESDGSPWLNRYTVAPDPTPRNPLTLELMAQDGAPSLYLGRPCYHGFATTPPCHPLLWTSRRYGPEVLDSMTAALNTILAQAEQAGKPFTQLAFIGYSGGGALAMLLAERFPQTQAVLTVAGNLDIDRWADWHGYSPLQGSLNPAARPPLSADIVQLHVIGDRDRNVPQEFIRSVVMKQHCSEYIVYNNFDHNCCWKTTWPVLLARLKEHVALTPDQCHDGHPLN